MDAARVRRVLVVEDEVMIAMLMEDMLTDLGYEVVGPAMRLEEGIELATTAQLDMAVLDVNLNGQRSTPIAEILAERGVPFVFATGYGSTGVDEPHNARHVLKKPFSPDDLDVAIARMIGGG
jgi:CheY-like chemotaxis protein